MPDIRHPIQIGAANGFKEWWAEDGTTFDGKVDPGCCEATELAY